MNQITQGNGTQPNASVLAIDLAKDVFKLAFANNCGRIVERKRLNRKPFSECFQQHAPPRRGVHASG